MEKCQFADGSLAVALTAAEAVRVMAAYRAQARALPMMFANSHEASRRLLALVVLLCGGEESAVRPAAELRFGPEMIYVRWTLEP
jgi:hypothetical protein